MYRKGVEEREKAIQDKKDRLKRALDENRLIDGDLRRDALALQKSGDWDDAGPQKAEEFGAESGGTAAKSSQDDEYRWAGVEDPKVMLTTSRDPSARLKKFAKEFRLLIPNSQRLNRGNYEFGQLLAACRANGVTDFIVLHEHRGTPDGLIICHLPFGPTAYFTISDLVMRHDIPDIGTMSEQYPHLVFHNFKIIGNQRLKLKLEHVFDTHCI